MGTGEKRGGEHKSGSEGTRGARPRAQGGRGDHAGAWRLSLSVPVEGAAVRRTMSGTITSAGARNAGSSTRSCTACALSGMKLRSMGTKPGTIDVMATPAMMSRIAPTSTGASGSC
eukprot:2722659-Prymnesium_polylepis.1